MSPDTPLELPDPERCQGETIVPTPFRLGGPMRTRVRCDKVPLVIATERQPGKDGRVGSMSLCGACKLELEKQLGLTYATYTKLHIENWP